MLGLLMIVLLMLVLFLCVALTLWRVLRIEVTIVPEEERLVIYQFGHFHRIAGPGPVWLWRGWERVERRINVRDQPRTVTLPFVYMYDIPIRFTLDCWYRIDPQQAANGDAAMLKQFVCFDDAERHDQMAVRVYDLFVKHVTALMQRHELPPNPSLLDKLLPILPGQPPCEHMLRTIQPELASALRRLGIVFNTEQPLTITGLYMPPSVVKLLDRNRMMQTLQQQLPGLTAETLLQAASADDGRPLENRQRFIFENGSDYEPVELESDENGSRVHIGHIKHRNIPAERRQRRQQEPMG